MKRLVLALPVLFLALSLDRIAPDRAVPPSEAVVASWDGAALSLPGINEGRDGRPGAPLNVVLVGRAAAVTGALSGAGWTVVPAAARDSLLAGLGELAAGKPVNAFPPMSDYRLRGRLQNFNWTIPGPGAGERRRLSLWRTGVTDRYGRGFWWGTASLERRGVPDADRNAARDFVASTLSASPRLRALALIPSPRVPTEGEDDRGRAYRTDGRVAVADLR